MIIQLEDMSMKQEQLVNFKMLVFFRQKMLFYFLLFEFMAATVFTGF